MALWAYGAQSNVVTKGGASHSSEWREHVGKAIVRQGMLLDCPRSAVLFANALEHVHILRIPELPATALTPALSVDALRYRSLAGAAVLWRQYGFSELSQRLGRVIARQSTTPSSSQSLWVGGGGCGAVLAALWRPRRRRSAAAFARPLSWGVRAPQAGCGGMFCARMLLLASVAYVCVM